MRLGVFRFFQIFFRFIILSYKGNFSMLLRLILITKNSQNLGQNSIKSFFFCPKGNKKPWPKPSAGVGRSVIGGQKTEDNFLSTRGYSSEHLISSVHTVQHNCTILQHLDSGHTALAACSSFKALQYPPAALLQDKRTTFGLQGPIPRHALVT